MVKLQLWIKARTENLSSVEPGDDFDFLFQVKCTSCQEVHPKFVSLNHKSQYETSVGKNSLAHFVWRCGMCKRESSAKFEPNVIQPYYNKNDQLEPLLTIDCRGLEFIDFDPRGSWKCVGMTGSIFSNADLTEGEWIDYDEKATLPVGIFEIGCEWRRARDNGNV